MMSPSYRETKTKRDHGHGSLRTAAMLGCAVVCLARVSMAAADIDVWATNGPYGVGVQALAVVAPDTLYAGTVFGGVFKSSDGGDSWHAVNTHLSSTNVFALAIDPVTP